MLSSRPGYLRVQASAIVGARPHSLRAAPLSGRRSSCASAGSARDAWTAAGREGSPRLWALAYFVLGPRGRETATEYLTDYYGDWGPGMAAGIPADADGIRATVEAFEATGADELTLDPVSSDLAQLDLLAEAPGDLERGISRTA
ncbi:hypothetical protein BH24CHL9_BH24CHL9_15270 [soil metagenome]